MDLIVLDMETHYSNEYSLSKMPTEAYIRDPRFEVIGVAVKVNNDETVWASGSHEEIAAFLNEFNWDNAMLLCQNTAFDGAILNWHFGIKAKAYADTMCMTKVIDGVHVSASLAKQTERHLPGHAKGTEIVQAKGLRRCQFSEPELAAYGDYCINDVELTYKLFRYYISKGFPKKELKVIDMTLRMFIDPKLVLDTDMLEKHLDDVQYRKEKTIEEACITREMLSKNAEFARQLQLYDVVPPTKISPKTGKELYAFAKTDEGFKALLEHENDRVQALAAARISVKSTLEETRTERFLGISKRGPMPIPLQYYGALTGRWQASGGEAMNVQNLPSRGPNAKVIKNTMMAPDGYVIVESDLSQIEARVLAWLAGQADLVQAFSRGQDVYKTMAGRIYNVAPEDVTPEQRQVGKTAVLGAGFGMGAKRFRSQLKMQANIAVDEEQALHIVRTYRGTYSRIKQLWYDANDCIQQMHKGYNKVFGKVGIITPDAAENRLRTPTGLSIYYPDLHISETTDKGPQYAYKSRKGPVKLYGGIVVENVVQHLARLIIADHMLLVQRRYPVVLTVHDSLLAIAPEGEAMEACKYIYACMHYVPDWAEGLPLDCELGYHKRYGSCDKNADAVTAACAAAYENSEKVA